MSGPVFFTVAILTAMTVVLVSLAIGMVIRRQQLESIRRQQHHANSAIDRLTMQALRSMLEEARRSSGHRPWGN